MKNVIIKAFIWVSVVVMWTSYCSAESVINTHTGANSTNSTTVVSTNNIIVSATNNAVIDNTINIDASTGSNVASLNTGNGTVTSGDISGNIDVSNLFNQTKISLASLAVSTPINTQEFKIENSNTGSGSTNIAGVVVGKETIVNAANNILLSNDANLNGSTGKNVADNNTGDGKVKSGNISFAVMFKNVGNSIEVFLGRGGGVDPVTPVDPIFPITPGGRGGGVPTISTNATMLPVAGGGLDNTIFAFLSAVMITFFAMLLSNKELDRKVKMLLFGRFLAR